MALPAAVASIAVLAPIALKLWGMKKDSDADARDYALSEKRFGLQEEQVENTERQRAFNRLMDLSSTGSKMEDRAMGISRLNAIRGG